ncbi:MAG: biopolymer transporter ExbD [Spirochaetes bacterium]|nr:biopolymer transporter ExbD [Spirochaetota bacterium]
MKIKRFKKHSILESSAASDAAFLLIIYFIVIAGFNINKGYLISLPAKDSAKLITKEDLIRFEIDGGGRIIYRDDAINISAAQSLIAGAQKNNPNIAVLTTIDRQAQWQSVVSFVELVQDMKVDSFSFTMKKDGP